MKKICFLTTSRADFGVMEQLIKDVINSKKFNVHLIVSGSHTEKIFGNIKQCSCRVFMFGLGEKSKIKIKTRPVGIRSEI